MTVRSRSRSAARLAAVQALYQHDMEATPIPALLHEFHQHRLGATIEDVDYAEAEVDFFDDLVKGTAARLGEIDGAIEGKLASGWTLARPDRPVKPEGVVEDDALPVVARVPLTAAMVGPGAAA